MKHTYSVFFVLFLLSTLVPNTSAEGISSFSTEIKDDHTYRWVVVNYTIDDSLVTERKGDHLFATGSNIEITVKNDPTKVNLSQSLDVSNYFDMTYDDTISKDLSTLYFMTPAGKTTSPYPIYWKDLIYFIFPVITDQGNFFDSVVESQLGLLWVNAMATTTAVKGGNELYFSQIVDGSYDFEIIFDYNSGVMQHASYTDDSTNVTIVLDDIFEVSNNFSLDIPSMFVITGIVLMTMTIRRKFN